MSITVYSKPGCVQCQGTCRALDRLGVKYDVVDITRDAAALDLVRSFGYLQVPVVVTESDRWFGFRPDRLRALAPDKVPTP